MKRLFLFFGMFFSTLFLISNAYSIPTYVGVKILNLTDDPSYSCVGEFDSGNDSLNQGRIRALSSMLPTYPIYFELTNLTDSSLVWSGNSNEDIDYEIGDNIMIPDLVDLTIGKDYKFFFDVDAIRIYLPVFNVGGFERTVDNEYWLTGATSSNGCYYTTSKFELWFSSSSACGGTITTPSTYSFYHNFISNTRDPTKFSHTCRSSCTQNDCDDAGLMGISRTTNNFNIGTQYNDLNTASVGNFAISFTYS